MFESLEADRYSINLHRLDKEIYNMELIFYYDKNGRDRHGDDYDTVFQRSMKHWEGMVKAMSIVGPCVAEVDKENLILRLSLTATLQRIADTIVGEFINYGSLGKATFSQLVLMASYASVDIINEMKDSMK